MKTSLATVVLTSLSLVPLSAQEPSPSPPSPKRVTAESLKVQFTLSRSDGEKKVLSLPNTLLIQANNRSFTKVRMGFEVPVRTSGPPADKDGTPAPATGSYQYRNVGVNIDCRVGGGEDGRYQIEGNIEQSSLYTPGDRGAAGLPDLPIFRTLSSVVNVALRDGQSTTLVSTTDPVSGESVRIDVALSVVR